MNENDLYLYDVINSYESTGTEFHAQQVYNSIENSILTWANGHLHGAYIAGSLAKGTAILGKSDIDILISVKDSAVETLKEVYTTLYNRLKADGYSPRKQNVSLGLNINGFKVDLVPAKRQNEIETVHSLWSHKKQSRRETDIHQHVDYVVSSGRQNEIKLMKIWSYIHDLDIPSFPLEVMIINALEDTNMQISQNFAKILIWISDNILTRNIIDPTKPSNILSEELTLEEKRLIKNKAEESFSGNFNEAVFKCIV
ncbi:MAG: nucleotidyltransferase domain-containing protein [Candidatus Saccharibacteria bacterium]|nr:nucleotidyltransferase domain-containing protein [Candidatus Saccharibacteria bacterium]